MAERYGILSIRSERGGTVAEIRSFLEAIENAYNNLYVFELFVTRVREVADDDFRINFYREQFNNVDSLILPEDRLYLRSVVIESPGVWEFLGSLNPLEVMKSFSTKV